jgi:hypothetical protein
MGRPLKIQKYGPSQGITYGANGAVNQPAAAVTVDAGYPNFGSLTDPVYNSADTLNSDQFLGVVGGDYTLSSPSTTFPVVKCQVNIALPSGAGAGVHDGRIIRQKGAHKYLVADGTTVNDEDCVVGAAYQILSLDTTDWQQMGAPAGAISGTIFTCTAVCASPQNGTALLVGQCVLTSDLTPGPGLMAISYTVGDSSAVAISKLTNKFLLNWSNFQNADGTSLDSYASGGNNTGEVIYSGEDELVANFFTDEGTVTKSGSETNATLPLAIVENFTS